MDIFCVAQNRGGCGRCGVAGRGVTVAMMTRLMVWSIGTKTPPRLDRCKSGAAVGVVATGAAEEMKDGPESPIE